MIKKIQFSPTRFATVSKLPSRHDLKAMELSTVFCKIKETSSVKIDEK